MSGVAARHVVLFYITLRRDRTVISRREAAGVLLAEARQRAARGSAAVAVRILFSPCSLLWVSGP